MVPRRFDQLAHLRYVSAVITTASTVPVFTSTNASAEQKSMCVHVSASGYGNPLNVRTYLLIKITAALRKIHRSMYLRCTVCSVRDAGYRCQCVLFFDVPDGVELCCCLYVSPILDEKLQADALLGRLLRILHPRF